MQKNETVFDRQQMIDVLHATAHDIRSPLTVILQGLDLLLDHRVGELNERQRSIVTSISKQGKSLHQILTEVLDLEKIEAGYSFLEKVPAIFSHILEVTVGEMQEQSAFANASLELEDQLPAALLINVDVFRIRQVLRNLISNALKYSPKNDIIKISARAEDNQLIISCSNFGPHIPEEKLTHIFNKFFQIQAEKKLGSGIGLAICKNVVELHGGKIWAENMSPKGMRFSFSLPTNT